MIPGLQSPAEGFLRMTGFFCRAALLLTLVSATASAQLPPRIGNQEMPTLAPLVKQVEPAVVSIATKGTVNAPGNPLMEDPFFRRFFGFPDQQLPQQRRREVQSAGSGVIVDAAKGYILTNHHVVENDRDLPE
jgi:S1-C subfamily serine protease